MAKKGSLGTAERYYIEQHCDTKDLKLIAKELDRTLSSVEEYANHFKMMRTKAGGQFARNDHGSVVMTPNASMSADEFRKKRGNASKRPSCTTTIKKHDN